MVANNKSFSILTGGGVDTLDAFPVADLLTGDFAFGIVSGLHHVYEYDEVLAIVSTNAPYQIVPADNVSGTGAWVLSGYQGAMSHVRSDRASVLSLPDAVWTTFVYNGTKSRDTLLEYSTSTGVFTAKHAGDYLVSAQYTFEAVSFVAGDETAIGIAVNADLITFVGDRDEFAANSSGIIARSVTTTVRLAAAETLKIVALQNSSGAVNAGGSSNRNYMTVDRLV